MSISLQLPASAALFGQLGVGAAGAFAGYRLGSAVVRSTYRDDMLGDPTRIVELDEDTKIFQHREPQGGRIAFFTVVGGGAIAFAGGALSGGGAAAMGAASLVRSGGGAALAGIGFGAIVGAAVMSAQYRGADHTPIR